MNAPLSSKEQLGRDTAPEETQKLREAYDCACLANGRMSAEIERLQRELETERMRLAGCGVAALCDTPDSMAQQRIAPDSPYYSASYGDVLRRTEECIRLRAALEAILDHKVDYSYKWVAKIAREALAVNAHETTAP